MLWDVMSDAEPLSISVPVGDSFPWDRGGGNGKLCAWTAVQNLLSGCCILCSASPWVKAGLGTSTTSWGKKMWEGFGAN